MSVGVMTDNTGKKEDGLPKTELGVMILKEMISRGLSIDKIRDIVAGTYETTRRYVRGETAVSEPSLKLLCEEFNWPFEALKVTRIRDTLRVKYGDLLDIAHDLDPDLQKISMYWPLLSETHKDIILQQVRTFAGGKNK